MSEAAPSAKVLRFGVFELDLQRGRLRKDGVAIKLQDKPCQVLVALLERPGELVTREQLRQRLWPADTFVDFNHGVNTAINKLREALGDPAGKPHFIETVPRHGYRFIFPYRAATQTPRTAIRLAVLPLENLSGDPAEEYFVDGMTEELITQLSGLQPGRLGVIARTSVMTYKQSRKSIDEIGRELDIDYAVEGSVRRSAGRVRISAQLIRVSDQTHVWAESYERELSDVLAIQDEVAHAIAARIRLQLAPERPQRDRNTTPAAYEAYLRGRHFFNKGNPADHDRILHLFRQSVEKDPFFAAAYAATADAYVFLAFYRGLPQESAYRARAAAVKAMELAPDLAGPHASLAVVLALSDWDWKGAEAEFKRAIQLDPWRGDTHRLYGIVLSLLGKPDQAIAQARQGRELDPLSSHANNDLAFSLYIGRRYDEASKTLRQTIELDPGFVPAHVGLGHVYVEQSRFEQALVEFAAPGARPEFTVWAHARAGNHGAARRVLADALSRGGPGLGCVELAATYGLLGEIDRALEYLEKGYEQREWLMVFLNVYPMFDPLRADPRFKDILRRMNFPGSGWHP